MILVLAILAVLCGYLYDIKLAGSRERCQANLRIIWKAAKLTGYGEGDRFPPSLQTIFTTAPDPKWYICPASGHNPGDATQIDMWSDYVYVSGLNESDPPSCVLAFCPPENHKGEGANVLFVDGSVRWYSVEGFKKLTNDPYIFFGVNDSNALEKLRSKTKILYPKH
jgi:prepilin-type processing-associated H-X9-DG protein